MKRQNTMIRASGVQFMARKMSTGLICLFTAGLLFATSAHSADTKTGVPTMVDATTDLGSQGPNAASDSIYFTSLVRATDGHVFGVLVQTVQDAPQNVRALTLAVTDITEGRYEPYQTLVGAESYSWSPKGQDLNITMPGLTWTGNANQMSVQATAPWGSLNFTLAPQGPALYYASTGEWPMLGERQDEFALPSMRITGSLIFKGKTYTVAGESWLDRQWGKLTQGSSNRWTWMNLSLSNGDRVALWYITGNDKVNCWATVLHPSGSHEVVAVKPLHASEYWTNPTTGTTYPTRWRVEIPSLRADLSVRLVGSNEQELGYGRIEGSAAVSGTYMDRNVTGHNFVELVGNWSY